MVKLICQFSVVFYFINYCSTLTDFPEVETPLGRIRGYWKSSFNGRKYAAFEGIPYAQPPVGDLRFEESQPVTPWQGTWAANITHVCIHTGLFSYKISGEEDCLYLNVYVPAEFLENPKKLHVIFSIHGGAFMMGSGHTFTNSSNFMDKDVVLVSINYRVGILGFLNTEDEVLPGNNGLKDQVLALKWVRDNIAAFSGNPDSVTLIGLSAGGASVQFHYLSPLSRGLFHRGIAQSGTALAPWAIKRNPLKNAKKLGELLECPGSTTEELKGCLKQKAAQDLLKQLPNFYGYKFLPFSPFAPGIEKPSEKAFLDREPNELLKEGKVLDLPMIISTVADDGLYPSAMFYSELDEIDKKWTEIFCHLLDCSDILPELNRTVVAKQILDHYLGADEKINRKNFKKFSRIFTDRLFAFPAEVAAKLQASVNKSPIYFYLFNYREGENKISQIYTKSPEVEGVAHGEDAIYCSGLFHWKPLSKQDERMKSYCQDMLYTFAATGKPIFGRDIWQPTRSLELTYLNITNPDNIKLETTKDFSSVKFWNSLGLLENERVIAQRELL